MLALAACGGEELGSALGDLTVTPAEVDFGPVWVGERAGRSLTFANDGRVAAALATSGVAAPFEAPGSVNVPSAGDVEVQVAFRPTAPGAVEAVAVFAASEFPPVEVKLKGEGVVASLDVAEVLDFGPVRVGDRLELALPVGNGAPLAVTEFDSRITGEDAGAFSIARDVRQIGAHSTAEFGIVFAPSAAMPMTAVLTVAPCAACDEWRIVLRGRGIETDLVATPPLLDFGAVPPLAERILGVQLENGGEAVATLATVRVEGEAFSLVDAGVPTVLSQGGTVDVTVRFAPAATADFTGILAFLDDKDNVVASVPLLGHGGGAVLAADPPALDLGRLPVGWSGSAQVRIENVGEDVPVAVTGATIEGGAAWSVTPLPVPAAVEEGGLPVRVSFAAAAVGEEAAVLVLATSSPGQPELRVPLTATVADDPDCTIVPVPARLRFGLVRPGQLYARDVDLVNAGAGPCIVWDVGLDPAGSSSFFLQDRPPDTHLLPGERMVVPVTFWPQAAAPEILGTTLRYRTSNLAAPAGEVPVTGYAPGADIVAIPDPLDFGTVPVNRAPRMTLRVVNRSYPAVQLIDFRLTPESDPEFGVVKWPQFPISTDATGGVEFVLDYHPVVAGPNRGLLEIEVQNHPEPLLVRLRGEGNDGPCGDECDPPIAQCPAPAEGLVNQATTLLGAGTDPNGDPINCEWMVVSAPYGSAAQPEPPEACTTQFIPDLVGAYSIRLRVRDPLGNVGECVTTYTARAPTTGLWVEMFWDLPNDVDLHLLHPSGGDPMTAAPWRTAPNVCYYGNMNPEWDLPGIVDNPSLDRDDTVNVGPENIRIDAPTAFTEYAVGVVFFHQRTQGPVQATVNVYCGGTQAASQQVQLTTNSELFFVGKVVFDSYGYCTFSPVGVHPTP